jgi:hypothetical protein
MSELLDRIHGEIRERLAASAAAVREYERLEAALAALDGVAAAPRPTTAQPSRASRKRPARRATAKRAPRGVNRAAALRAIGERPGIGVADLIAATGINRPVLYALLARLVEQGAVVKQALPGDPAGYALRPTPVAPSEHTTARVDAPAEPSVVSDEVEAPSEGVAGEGGRPESEAKVAPSTPEETPARDASRARRPAKAPAAPNSGAAAKPSASESGAGEEFQTGPAASAPSPQATPAQRNVPRPRRAMRKPAAQRTPNADSPPTEIVASESAQGDAGPPASTQQVPEPQTTPRSRRRAKPKPSAAD